MTSPNEYDDRDPATSESFFADPYPASQQASLSFPDPGRRRRAEMRRDEGMRRVAEHAEQVIPDWGDLAYESLETFVGLNDGKFLAEQFIAWAADHGLPIHDTRAFGSVMTRAVRRGLITKVGYSSENTNNCSPKPLWRAVAQAVQP